jgi:hypothetical protein
MDEFPPSIGEIFSLITLFGLPFNIICMNVLASKLEYKLKYEKREALRLSAGWFILAIMFTWILALIPFIQLLALLFSLIIQLILIYHITRKLSLQPRQDS